MGIVIFPDTHPLLSPFPLPPPLVRIFPGIYQPITRHTLPLFAMLIISDPDSHPFSLSLLLSSSSYSPYPLVLYQSIPRYMISPSPQRISSATPTNITFLLLLSAFSPGILSAFTTIIYAFPFPATDIISDSDIDPILSPPSSPSSSRPSYRKIFYQSIPRQALPLFALGIVIYLDTHPLLSPFPLPPSPSTCQPYPLVFY